MQIPGEIAVFLELSGNFVTLLWTLKLSDI